MHNQSRTMVFVYTHGARAPREDETVNPDRFGKRLAEFFASTLPTPGFVLGLVAPREWGSMAMQRINVRIINPDFLLVFIGSTVVCALVALLCVLHLDAPGGACLLAGALACLAGPFGVTIAFNIRLNNGLAGTRPEQAALAWPPYLARRLAWNHVRTALGVVATALLAVGLFRLGAVPA